MAINSKALTFPSSSPSGSPGFSGVTILLLFGDLKSPGDSLWSDLTAGPGVTGVGASDPVDAIGLSDVSMGTADIRVDVEATGCIVMLWMEFTDVTESDWIVMLVMDSTEVSAPSVWILRLGKGGNKMTPACALLEVLASPWPSAGSPSSEGSASPMVSP